MSSTSTRSPYAAPRAPSLDVIGVRTPLYTPTQIALGTFFGGIVAFVYFLRANFLALGNTEAAHKTVLGGAALFAVMLALAFALPRGGSMGIALLIAGLARWIAERHQMTKDAIAASSDHDFHSSWRVAGIALACFAIAFALVFGATLAIALLTTR
jgi:hypothetical protein